MEGSAATRLSLVFGTLVQGIRSGQLSKHGSTGCTISTPQYPFHLTSVARHPVTLGDLQVVNVTFRSVCTLLRVLILLFDSSKFFLRDDSSCLIASS